VSTVLLTPRYDGVPVLQVRGLTGDPSIPLLRQRRRLAQVLATLEPEQWSSSTRCKHWSVQDIVMHLVGASELWRNSIAGGRAGLPTRLFQSFDPVVTPPRLVDAMRGWTPAEALARLVETTDAIADTVAGFNQETWSMTGESPLGHVGLHLVAVHALWDSWIHERDMLLPLGLSPVEEADEVLACLWYVASLGPALLATGGSTRCGTLGVTATSPQVRVIIEVGPHVVVLLDTQRSDVACLVGRAADLIEDLSFRATLSGSLSDHVADEDRWLLTGLDAAFDVISA
jgi:uncharacterized protein (TIGR03083 family)